MELTCIVCPRSCRITVEEKGGEIEVRGNSCPRGKEHALNEYTCPKRVLTTTVAITGASLPRLPVISVEPVPKARLKDCLQALYRLRVQAPVKEGDTLMRDVCGTGVDVIAAKTMKKRMAGQEGDYEKNLR